MKLSLIVPCYNEVNNVRPFFEACRSAFSGEIGSYEVIFVNDGSGDGTEAELLKLHAEEKCVSVITFSRNFGKEAAMLAGLEKAGGEYISIIDADLQQKPETVLEMVRILDDDPGYDCVAAYQEKRREGIFKKVAKSLFYKLINRMGEVKLHPDASDFRTFRRCVAEAILSLPEYHRFSKGIFSWVGFETYYLPYVADKRNSGKSTWSLRKLFRYSVDGITDYSVSPLKIPARAGILAIAASAVYFIVKLISGTLTEFSNGVLFALILLLWGIMCIFIGIVGTYVSKDYTENKRRPKYIIKDYRKNGIDE